MESSPHVKWLTDIKSRIRTILNKLNCRHGVITLESAVESDFIGAWFKYHECHQFFEFHRDTHGTRVIYFGRFQIAIERMVQSVDTVFAKLWGDGTRVDPSLGRCYQFKNPISIEERQLFQYFVHCYLLEAGGGDAGDPTGNYDSHGMMERICREYCCHTPWNLREDDIIFYAPTLNPQHDHSMIEKFCPFSVWPQVK